MYNIVTMAHVITRTFTPRSGTEPTAIIRSEHDSLVDAVADIEKFVAKWEHEHINGSKRIGNSKWSLELSMGTLVIDLKREGSNGWVMVKGLS